MWLSDNDKRKRAAITRTILAWGNTSALFYRAAARTTPAHLMLISREASMDENGVFAIRDVDTNTLRTEADKTAIPSGGSVTLSVNITHGDAGLMSKIDNFLTEWSRRLFTSKRVHDVQRAVTRIVPQRIGWSIGNLFTGRYVDESGNVFDERSFTVDLAGVDSDALNQIAESLRSEFSQQTVLVNDRNTGETYFQSGEAPPTAEHQIPPEQPKQEPTE